MTQSFTKTDNSEKSVVLLEYPRKGIWVVGFATKENKGVINDKVKEDLVNIFVPTTPNPTSGFLLMLPKKDLIYLDVSFEQAFKIYSFCRNNKYRLVFFYINYICFIEQF